MRFFRLPPLCLILLSLLTASMVVMAAEPSDAGQSLAERYAAGSIDSNERANAALADIVAARGSVDSMYAGQRDACYSRFFASACLNDVRQRKRVALSKIRQVEVEANAFLRKEKAAERDRALAERDERAKQQPGGRARPISGVTREPPSGMPATDSPATDTPAIDTPATDARP